MRPRFKPTAYFRQCVGIDMAKGSFTACMSMVDDEGCSTPAIEFKNNRTGFNQLVRWTRKEMLPDYPVYFVMEPTGVYYEALAMHLTKIGFTVYVVPANRVRDYAKFEGYTTKTDSIDAYVLSILGCDKRRLKAWSAPDPVLTEIRTLCRLRAALVKQQTMLKNQLEALSNSSFCSGRPSSLCGRVLSDMTKGIKRIEDEIEKCYGSSFGLKVLLDYAISVPGIGKTSAITILTETGCFANFSSQRRVISFAGLDVVARQSGTSDPKRRISKKGNIQIRTVLYTCAMSAICHCEEIREFYLRIKKSNPAGKVAITAVMRKLLILVYTMCKKQTFYSRRS